MFLRNRNNIKTVKITSSSTQELYPTDRNRTFCTLEIIMHDGSRKEESYTDRQTMWWYGEHLTQDDLNKYFGGKKGIIFNPIQVTAIGAGALTGALVYGGLGLFAGAVVGYVIPKAVEQVNDFLQTK